MRRALKGVAPTHALVTQIIDGLEERFLAMLPPVASCAWRVTRREE